ncbi:MAG: galactokinase [Bacteroidota bacterium]
MNLAESVEAIFQKKFKEQPLLIRSPGRVNLIGEHTDYNKGYVLPAAIDKSIYFAIAPRKDRRCIVVAIDMNDEHEFSVDDLQFSKKGWPNYLMGVVDQFVKAKYSIRGFNCVFGGDIPIGAGMSSSAALEAGLAFAINYMFDLQIDALSLVKLAQKAENEFVGVRCGIMDQYINIFGARDNVLRIDCRSLEYKYYPFAFHTISLVLFDTRVSHSLASSAYNRRREECSEGVAIIKTCNPEVNSLRDVSGDMIQKYKNKMDSTIYQRCKYVVEENDRVLQACRELEKGDLKAFGKHMSRTHEGLSHDYEVSCKELDYLVELVQNDPQIYGSRMMGGGFGGCTINLVENNHIDDVSNIVTERYKQKFNIDLKTYITSINSGTNIITTKNYAEA